MKSVQVKTVNKKVEKYIFLKNKLIIKTYYI
ncbi:MAG: hypothetical protein UR62_C0009G0015 [Candidatus Nomurabacteria bacterium GW2011_GWF2_35_12]|uniref:Uncharacterized protein n=3 Tax=Candidatus Nomuraibacteriota TaxID=1752729 RepID=A0A0G0GDN6_9BACT|nr:MAG: hypothetical protein UR62_C0009G0015 [Candidatus Nomurabacteria bacterium GW2011_GWF2_35_12]KKP72797.1 MAG: hypothetical protein UR70_C0004G0040 [Candidatus Nomurabacteria bacterium GW2011_GWB1_35_20]KKP75528.1 MAG: hypothetical protein UR72_C0005G0045 [Parcubacteria group bacterium GW2011_GWC1_35_21]KKP78019.1 MAG: hypothetical protein UR77_C0008G0014 [Candidatus Nomurabacteria bacterium GW2011_GWC2_35_35]KKP85440.1 MAG: hypothetical protein UR86_C0003G0010 [Parcubacteria group bacteri